MNIEHLPPEIILNVFSFLPQHLIITTLPEVCRLWKDLSVTPSLWWNVNTCLTEDSQSEQYLQNFGSVFGHVKHLRTNEEFLAGINFCYPDRDFISAETLDLSSEYLISSSIVKRFISKCPNLHSLFIRLDKYIIFQNLFSGFDKLDIHHLELYYNGDDDDFLLILESLCSHRCLKSLSIHSNTIQNNTVHFLFRHFTNVRSCDITSSYLKNETFMTMKRMSSLISLNIDYTRVDDNGLKHISENVPNLRTFSVVRCENITDIGISCIAKNCPLIRQVSICRSHTISGNALSALAERCPELRRMSVMGCAQVDDDGVISLVKKCVKLRVLILNFCIQLSDQSLVAISKFCPLLRRLDISHNGKFTSLGVSNILQTCIWLESFNCASCGRIQDMIFPSKMTETDDDLASNKTIHQNCHPYSKIERDTYVSAEIKLHHNHVRSINLSHTSVDDLSVLELSFFCPDLRNLYMYGCDKITSDIIDQLFKNCVFMEKISVKRKTIYRKNYKP